MKKYTKFLISMFKIGCIGFGGGSAMIPCIEDEIVTKQKIDTKENIDQDVIVASITPGALPLEIAASIGRRNFDRRGMVMGAVMMALPGALATVLLMTMLSQAQSALLTVISLISVPVSAFIIFLLASYIIKVLRSCREESAEHLHRAMFLMGAVFLIVCEKNLYRLFGMSRVPVFGVSTIHVLLLAFFCIFYSRSSYNCRTIPTMLILGGLFLMGHGKAELLGNVYLLRAVELIMVVLAAWGLIQNIRESRWSYERKGYQAWRDIRVWILMLVVLAVPAIVVNLEAIEFGARGVLSALVSFGGGDAYLTIADGLFVETGIITESQYYGQIVPVVNVLPGSILCKTLAGIGYCLGYGLTGTIIAGILFALVGFVGSIASSCGFFMLIYHFYDSLVNLHVIRMISRWIRPIIAGLLMNIMLSLLNQSWMILQQYLIK